MSAPAYAKQPSTLRPGAWCHLRRGGETVLVTRLGHDHAEAESQDGRRTIAGLRPSDFALLTPEEAAPLIAARSARLVRDDDRKASRGIDVSGRSHFARCRR